jgi:hypothetical protein
MFSVRRYAGNTRGMSLWYERLVSMQDGRRIASAKQLTATSVCNGSCVVSQTQRLVRRPLRVRCEMAGDIVDGLVPSCLQQHDLSCRRSVWLHVRWCRLPMRSGLVHIFSASGTSVSVSNIPRSLAFLNSNIPTECLVSSEKSHPLSR